MAGHFHEKDEHRPLLSSVARNVSPKSKSKSNKQRRRLARFFETIFWASLITLSVTILAGFYIHRSDWLPSPHPHHHHHHDRLTAKSLETCAWSSLKAHIDLLDVAPIPRAEFLARQQTLAASLREADVDAFIAEPSASSAYYANISASYSLSERPFLMIIDENATFSYLVPKFEAGRIAGLDMVFTADDGADTAIEWREEESPYEVLAKATGFTKVMVDEHVRFMIASGLQGAGVEIVPMSEAIQSLRSVKTEAEIAILRGINSFTLELVRSVQKCIQVGVTQEALVSAAQGLFSRAGVGQGFWAIALFGDQAAFPHGGKHGKTLEEGEFVLLDIGSVLHGYSADVTRTFLPNGVKVSDELWAIWETVYASQSAGFNKMFPNETCSAVDAASREPIAQAGYAEFYTHRLGHGLGLEMHEHPYLNGANSEKLKAGEVASNEPVSESCHSFRFRASKLTFF